MGKVMGNDGLEGWGNSFDGYSPCVHSHWMMLVCVQTFHSFGDP